MKFSAEQIKKAKEAKTAEELSALAKENGIELTEKQAEAFFASLGKDGELSDVELAAVAGGKGEEPEPVHPDPKYKAGESYWIKSSETWCTIVGVNWSDYYNEWVYSVEQVSTFHLVPGVTPPASRTALAEYREHEFTNIISGSAIS